jgi:hypothetical protein
VGVCASSVNDEPKKASKGRAAIALPKKLHNALVFIVIFNIVIFNFPQLIRPTLYPLHLHQFYHPCRTPLSAFLAFR